MFALVNGRLPLHAHTLNTFQGVPGRGIPKVIDLFFRAALKSWHTPNVILDVGSLPSQANLSCFPLTLTSRISS